jgi:hypothetical protein
VRNPQQLLDQLQPLDLIQQPLNGQVLHGCSVPQFTVVAVLDVLQVQRALDMPPNMRQFFVGKRVRHRGDLLAARARTPEVTWFDRRRRRDEFAPRVRVRPLSRLTCAAWASRAAAAGGRR